MHLKLLQKSDLKKAEATGDLAGNKFADRITKISKTYNIIIQKHLQMNMIKKYLKKYMYLQKKGRKLLMI